MPDLIGARLLPVQMQRCKSQSAHCRHKFRHRDQSTGRCIDADGRNGMIGRIILKRETNVPLPPYHTYMPLTH